ncbi:hypothetical protein SAMN06265350_103204 [Solitalea koreensis]|uniref:Four helix bundle sensory module for signal transduction n=2 Tax=Solitalea koreensis TaxID=543615 RepID=A0A521C4D1_9SPHI|nr:hypothetical protein SAMN06265350_103204 [Solitalea koreensis]
MGLAGTQFIYKLGKNSKAILKDNYASIEWAKEMMQQLDNMNNAEVSKARAAAVQFDSKLKLEESNITEIGEKETVKQLRANFEYYQQNPSSQLLSTSIRTNLYKISELNMQALERKNGLAQKTADNAILYISLLLAVCVLICFSLIFNIPSFLE